MHIKLLALVLAVLPISAGRAAEGLPTRVTFDGPGQVKLVGYLFRPAKAVSPVAAVVLMHGRLGPYSTKADGVYDATTLSKRHLMWGRIWAEDGYLALLVDSFGPRGYPKGFPIHSYSDRPDSVNEVTVRPLDAYAALAYLRMRRDVDPTRVVLMGWSNGGSATLATMAESSLAAAGGDAGAGFRGALAFYPACGLKNRFDAGYKPYAPVRVLIGDSDEEVSAPHCARFVEANSAAGDIAITVYPGATHGFDDPGEKRRSVEANAAATADAIHRARAFVRRVLRP